MATVSSPHTAGEIMDRVAVLMNDPAKTDYTYLVTMPYLNMAISELNEHMEEANIPITDQSLYQVIVSVGQNAIVNPPPDAIEYQEIAERPNSDWTTGEFYTILPRRDFGGAYPISNSLQFWCLEDNKIKFNELGANIPIHLRIRYIRRVISLVYNPEELIKVISATTYLSYKTAALCAMFVGENPTRAAVLDTEADEALDRMIGIGTKGRQQIMTRHRPFRAGYKMRGY